MSTNLDLDSIYSILYPYKIYSPIYLIREKNLIYSNNQFSRWLSLNVNKPTTIQQQKMIQHFECFHFSWTAAIRAIFINIFAHHDMKLNCVAYFQSHHYIYIYKNKMHKNSVSRAEYWRLKKRVQWKLICRTLNLPHVFSILLYHFTCMLSHVNMTYASFRLFSSQSYFLSVVFVHL